MDDQRLRAVAAEPDRVSNNGTEVAGSEVAGYGGANPLSFLRRWTVGTPLLAIAALAIYGHEHLQVPLQLTPELTFPGLVAVIHVVLLSVLLILRKTSLRFDDAASAPRSAATRTAWKQYKFALDGLVFSWLGTYVLLAVMWMLYGTDGNPLLWACADVLNIAGAASAFLAMHLILDQPSAPDRPGGARPFENAWRATCVISFTVAVFSGWARLQTGADGAVGPPSETARLALMLGSIFSAVAMAFFFGRFDHRHMRVARVWMLPHGLYLGIQVFWPQLVNGQGWLTPVVLFAALILKIVMLVAQYHWMRRGVIQRYLDLAAL